MIIQTGRHTRHAKRQLECEWTDPDTISCKSVTPDTFLHILQYIHISVILVLTVRIYVGHVEQLHIFHSVQYNLITMQTTVLQVQQYF